jgi:hypothetical protein
MVVWIVHILRQIPMIRLSEHAPSSCFDVTVWWHILQTKILERKDPGLHV